MDELQRPPYVKDAPPRVFDTHVHFPWRPRGAPVASYSPDSMVDMLAYNCHRLNILKVCLLGRPGEGNDLVEQAFQRYPGLIVPFAMVLLDETTPDAVHDFAARGFRGLKIINPRRNYDHPAYFPIYAAAEAEQVPTKEWNAPVVPYKVSHTVLNTPDIDRAVDFYTRVLGFRLSDWNGHWMAFLRCNTDHHSVAFAAAPHVSLNHIAYEVPTKADIARGVETFAKRGQNPIWGPGRHGPGNNLFAYFRDPAGMVCEYTAEVEQVDEARWVCRVWDRVETPGGPPPTEARLAMEGKPDPYVAPA